MVEHLHAEVKTEVKHLKSPEVPAMIVFNEFMRRYQEMNTFGNRNDFDMLKNHTLVVNADNKTIQKILTLAENGEQEKVNLLIQYVHDLALLEQKPFSGKELQAFIEKSNKILELV